MSNNPDTRRDAYMVPDDKRPANPKREIALWLSLSSVLATWLRLVLEIVRFVR